MLQSFVLVGTYLEKRGKECKGHLRTTTSRWTTGGGWRGRRRDTWRRRTWPGWGWRSWSPNACFGSSQRRSTPEGSRKIRGRKWWRKERRNPVGPAECWNQFKKIGLRFSLIELLTFLKWNYSSYSLQCLEVMHSLVIGIDGETFKLCSNNLQTIQENIICALILIWISFSWTNSFGKLIRNGKYILAFKSRPFLLILKHSNNPAYPISICSAEQFPSTEILSGRSVQLASLSSSSISRSKMNWKKIIARYCKEKRLCQF